MIKKIHILLIFLFEYCFIIAQPPIGFINRYYLSPNFNNLSLGVAETDYGYIVNGILIDTVGNPNGYWVNTLIGIDFNGNKLWEKKYPPPLNNFIYSHSGINFGIKKIDDSSYLIINNLKKTNGFTTSIILFLNKQGDTLFTREYWSDYPDSLLYIESIRKTKDKGFIISGSTGSDNDSYPKVFIMKTDSNGTVEWKKKYFANIQYAKNIFSTIQDTITKRYVSVGYHFNSSIADFISFVLITDSLGNQIHLKYFNSASLADVKQLKNGSFIACGSEYTGTMIGSWEMQKSMLVSFDINGNLIWKSLYGEENIINIFKKVELLSNDTIIVAGEIDTIFKQNMGPNSMYQLYKVTPSGNIVWNRFVDIEKGNGNQDVFLEMIITNTYKGFALTGYPFGNIPSQDYYLLVKLDEWGCLDTGCQAVGINELNKNNNLFSIFPNPADNQIYIKFEHPDLLPDTYEIIDLYGKTIMSGKINSPNTQINIEYLPSSIYLLQIKNKGLIIENKKISINH